MCRMTKIHRKGSSKYMTRFGICFWPTGSTLDISGEEKTIYILDEYTVFT